MYLIAKSLNMFFPRQRLSKSLHIVRILVLGSKHAHWDRDPLCIIGRHFSGMGFGCSRERCALLRCQDYNLMTGTHLQPEKSILPSINI